MRLAILSDIHGNIVALEAALADLERRGGADIILVTGDMLAYGPAPKEVLTLLQRLPDTYFLRGNAERYLLERNYPSAPSGNHWTDNLLSTFPWTANRLGREEMDFLTTLPAYQVIQVGSRQILAVHGSPRSDEEGLTVETEVGDFERMLIGPQVAIVVCGHTHVPMDRTLDWGRVVNAGSVGIPFDGDPRACYVVIHNPEANGSGPTRVEFRRIHYDIEKAVRQLYARDCPGADISAYNLRTARSLGGSSLIYTEEMRCRQGV